MMRFLKKDGGTLREEQQENPTGSRRSKRSIMKK
jgi:hypothetical protein